MLLHAKQLLVVLIFESPQIYANHLWGSMLANYAATQCVNPWAPVCIRNGISIHRRVDSHLGKTRPAALKICSCPIFNDQDQVAKLTAFIQQVDRRKLTASVLLVFGLIATLCSRQGAALATSVFFKQFVRL